jgi:protein tyrosine phosphatase (PTP) superfamily phosphohydrolase (DUF442 family)
VIKFTVCTLVFGGFAILTHEAWNVLVGTNLHAVIGDQVYRSAQLSPDDLLATIRRFGIRSVINLRGPCPTFPWYREECTLLEQAGVERYDVMFCSYSMPAVHEMRQFLHVLETCTYPVLMHCRRGADRAGLASSLTLLLKTSASVADASQQLSWRYGHLPFFRRSDIGQVLALYESWLLSRKSEHRPELLRAWIRDQYKPGLCWARIEPLEVPERLPFGRPVAARFRVHNESDFPWQFRQNAKSGVHLRYLLRRMDQAASGSTRPIHMGGAGFFDSVVRPGENLDLTLSLPAIREPGRYHLMVDMADEQRCWFFLFGSPRFEREYVVHPAP